MWDLAFPLERAGDLAVELRVVGFDDQSDVGPPFEAPVKNACVVCRASARISVPAKSIVLSSSWSAVRSLDAGVDGDLSHKPVMAIFGSHR